MGYKRVLSTHVLTKKLDQDNLLIVDVRAKQKYLQEHIPLAIHLDCAQLFDGDPSCVSSLTSESVLHKLFSDSGISTETHVVVYDDEGGLSACRLLWLLDVIGHKDSSLLNGGITAWKAEGLALNADEQVLQAVSLAPIQKQSAVVTKEYVQQKLFDEMTQIIDTRSIAEFTGEVVVANEGGHIPGAIQLDWFESVDKDNNLCLQPADILLKKLNEIGITQDKEIIVYCQNHVSSCHTYFVLKAMGYENVLCYAGGWQEWSACECSPKEFPQQKSSAAAVLPLVVDAEMLQQHMHGKNVLIVDVSLPSVYNSGHIEGAIRLDYPSILYVHDDCDCDIPSEEVLSEAFSAIGLTPETHVVAYDRQGGPMACRLLWTLEAIGHVHYSLLNGGLSRWQEAGYAVTDEEYEAVASDYKAIKQGTANIEKDEIQSKIGRKNSIILDVRMEEEFTNELLMTDRGGRIPGAVHYDWLNGVDDTNHERFKPTIDILTIFNDLGINYNDEIIIYCQTHLRSSHTYILLKRLGYKNIRGYAAGYSEWGNDPGTPIENECEEEN